MEPIFNNQEIKDDFLKAIVKDDLRPYIGEKRDIQNGFLISYYIPDDRSPDSIEKHFVDFDKALLTFEKRENGSDAIVSQEHKLTPNELVEITRLVESYDKVPNKTIADFLEFILYYRYINSNESVVKFPDTPPEEFIAIKRYVDKLL